MIGGRARSAIRVGRRLTASDLPLLFAAFVIQVLLGTALRVAPARVLARTIARCRGVASRVLRRLVPCPEERLAWAIEGVGRRLPGMSTCLVRALTADLLLGGHPSTAHVRVGVRHAPDGSLESHAWFERDGRILVGGREAAEYTPFMTLDCGKRIADCG